MNDQSPTQRTTLENDSTERRVLFVIPTFHRKINGGSIYYHLLANMLLDARYDVTIVCDMEKGEFDGRYISLFPVRAGRDKKRIRDLLSYAWQNVTYLRLPGLIRKLQPDILIIHSWFLIYPGLFPLLLAHIARARRRPTLVLDVRDLQIPKSRAHYLKAFDHFIACSESVAMHLQACGLPKAKISNFPVIQSFDPVDPATQEALLARHGLRRDGYLCYVGAIMERKGVPLLFEAFLGTFRKLHPSVPLVLVGPLKTYDRKILMALKTNGIRYLGPLEHSSALALMHGAMLCLNFAPTEGLSRASLEALEMGKRVLLSPNVPEFVRFCPDHVVKEIEPETVGKKMDWALSTPPPQYPIEQHSVERVMPAYLALFGELQRQ